MIIYLYVKTHNKTGLKYLGKTSNQNPHNYSGSGKIWLEHLKQHGIDFSTEILKECSSNKELTYWGRFYSELWNVVNDPIWANKIPETGGGGPLTEEAKEKLRQHRIGKSSGMLGKRNTAESNEKRSASIKGKQRPNMTEEWKNNISNGRKGKGLGPKSEEVKRKIGDGNRGKKRPNNGLTIKDSRWYNNGKENFRGTACPNGFKLGRLLSRDKRDV